jgi:subtilisin family serine protease
MPVQRPTSLKLRTIGLSVAAAAAVSAPAAFADEVAYTEDGHPYVKGEMLVKVRSRAALEGLLDRSRDSFGALSARVPLKETSSGTWYKVLVKEDIGSMYTAREAVLADGVVYAEPNFIYQTQIGGRPGGGNQKGGPDYEEIPELPNPPVADPDADQLHGLDLIDAGTAWAINRGSKDVIVGDIDTGADYNHPDLINNIWRNPKEIPGNGKDDDNNGFVDDVVGWDFRDKDARPFDDNAHGSHTAGSIGATGGNGVGISGVAQNTSIMVLRFLGGANGSGTSEDAIKCVEYATANGADLTSNSWGGGGYSQALFDAIAEADKAGILFVAAAGNARSDNDRTPSYPASYELDNILTVAATDSMDVLANFSNFGATSVDLAAPGVDILSTVPGKDYKKFSGTSMATPHVSGAAALLKAAYPQLKAKELKELLMSSVENVAGLSGKVVTGGRLNIARAFEIAKSTYGSPNP